ncbi:MAG: hypothetical protein ABJG75_10465 [Roseobacter sp.]
MSTITLIRNVAARCESTLLQDAVGAFALFVILFVGLYLPTFV